MKRFVIFVGAILAGLSIGIGGIVYLTLDNKIVGALMFGVGLYAICVHGLNLFTGKVGYVLENPKSYILDLIIIWFGNYCGTALASVFVWLSRIGNNISELAGRVCEVKLNDSLLSLFMLGIFCGMLMYSAVDGYKLTHNPLILFVCVSVFILCGFEHCVADMFYFCVAKKLTLEALSCIIVVSIGNAFGAILIPSYKGGRNDKKRS